MSLAERFRAKVDVRGPDECWPWTAGTDDKGYGRISAGKRGVSPLRASRVAWQLANGPIPEGLCALHSCDNPPCCNPAHLFLGTRADNNADMAAKGRKRGINGCLHGEAIGTSKLTERQVREVKRRATGRHGEQTVMARELGVDQTLISQILRGKAWAHVTA